MPNNTITHLTTSISSLIKKVNTRIKYIKTLQVVSLKPNQPSKGNVLLSYRIEPFLLKPGQPVPNDQSWNWECLLIAQTFLDLGYSVDVIQFHNDEFVPQKDYAFFIDLRHRLEALTPLLNKDCIKIFHVDIANMVFRNAAECNRLLELQQRRGITLRPQRFETPNLGIEYADYATVLGNDFTVNTFKYANKPMFRIPISSSHVYPCPDGKDFEAIRKHFLWFGGSALVLKGLDLVLDAFAQMPEYHLTVCGPVSNDKEFEKAFYKELYETPNIHTHGWVDVSSPEFLEITNNCLGLVYPSVSEGQAGAVITSLQAGLIPILTYESGVDVHDFGVILKNYSLEEIKATVRKIANLPGEDLKLMSCKAWEYARENHTKEKFAEAYRNAVEQMIEHRQKN
ncbi:glycosyltransferase [Komarekiella sp. 'clone 1']|uniref:Glycosyltransferase n=1 Tax=Komarekiella delphini-convector SJRDD-AB1 TaxID=2593771 RepID=A0AA40T1J2_9NOST|nr:glycosyltransferase [Komarekiella delphini-convector]MBD6619251.1 glycosyltransferase [Komarekiella delphini-convector SJRDD-AB1]